MQFTDLTINENSVRRGPLRKPRGLHWKDTSQLILGGGDCSQIQVS